MKRLSPGLIGLLLLSCNSAIAEDTISRGEIIDTLKTTMANALCVETSHVFVDCFEGMTVVQCKGTVKTLMNKCISDHQAKMPEQMNLSQVQHWGSVLGGCVGTSYKSKYKAQFKQSCN